MTTWMLYLLLLSFLLVGAALAAESALRRLRLPTRGAWLGMITASLALPVLLPTLRELVRAGRLDPSGTLGADPFGTFAVGLVEPVVVTGPAIPAAPALDPLLLVGWVAASVLVAGFLAVSALRLRRRSRLWSSSVVDRTPVLISADTGPAVVGLLGSRIVLPEWALELPASSRALLLRHEREHQRAGDVPLLNLALTSIALCPWNPCLWYALRRLRLAIEVDCDARVLRDDPDLAAYGGLLVAVGGRIAEPRGFSVAAVEKRSSLEERIRIMTAPRTRRARLTAVPLAGLAVGILLVSCEVPEPTRSPVPPQQPDRVMTEEELAAEPAFTPRTADPRLPNDQRVILTDYLGEHGPAAAGETDEALRTSLWVFIGSDGRIGSTRVAESSGVPAFDAVAEDAIRRVHFSPAQNREVPVPVWVQLPIVYQPTGGDPVQGAAASPGIEPAAAARDELTRLRSLLEEQERSASRADAEEVLTVVRNAREALRSHAEAMELSGDTVPLPLPWPDRHGERPAFTPRTVDDTIPRPRPRPLGEQPTFTPRTVDPRLSDEQRQVMTRYLEASYPAELREAGIDGHVVLWAFIDERGRVRNTQIVESSGHPRFDEIAQQALREVTFHPARNRDEVVPVWVQIPIQYNVRR